MVSGLPSVQLGMSAAEASELIEQEAMALHERRERRRVKGVGNRRPRCKACASFMTSSSSACKACGYREGIGR